MGLLLYKKHHLSETKVELTSPEVIKLSGKQGIIARYVEAHRIKDDLNDWHLNSEDIPALLGYDSGEYMVCFASKNLESGNINLSEVLAFQGKTDIVRTDSVIMHRAIASYPVEAFPDTMTVDNSTPAEMMIEPFGLAGGISKGPHSWSLVAPKMHIGGVIV